MILVFILLFINLLNINGQFGPNETCGSWCRDIPESAFNSTNCMNYTKCSQDNCVTIPDSECGPGNWSWANSLIDGNWIPSRSTHYGGTSGGACGFGATPNCAGENSCPGVPNEIQTSIMAGQYAAPQGDFYAQYAYLTGYASEFDYLSCGSCFEIRCDDPKCENSDSVYLYIADACPCAPNIKWCCGKYSNCNEIGPDRSGQQHCATSDNGLWLNSSLHLDLSDPAFNNLTGNGFGAGVVNTQMRRVSCPVKGNVFIKNVDSDYNDNCYTVYGENPRPCFYYLSIVPYNIGGYGGVTDVSVFASFLVNGELVSKNATLERNENYPKDKPQEQYGTWVNVQNEAIFFPVQFFIMDTVGRQIASPIYNSFNDSSGGLPDWLDIGTQFEAISFH